MILSCEPGGQLLAADEQLDVAHEVRLHGRRDLVPAEVTVRPPKGPPLLRLARADASYASASDPRVLIALGEAGAGLEAIDVEVKWPGGKREVFVAVPLRRYTTLVRGEGAAKPAEGGP